MVNNKILILLSVLLCNVLLLRAQRAGTLSLDEAYQLATAHYPNAGADSVWVGIVAQQNESLAKGYLPQFSLNAQATYQSDVTQLNIPLPGVSIDPLSRDQYKATGELTQVLFDAGAIRTRQAVNDASGQVEQDKVAVELFQLREQVNQLFLRSLYLEQQAEQVKLVREDIATGLRKVKAQVENGVSFRSNQQVLEAEWLRTGQRVLDVQYTREGLLESLGILIGQPLDTLTHLEVAPESFSTDTVLRRPELKLFTGQQQLVDQQQQLLKTSHLPKAQLFVQGGYGKPALNLLKNEFDFFYIGGVRLNWAFGNFYNYKQEKRTLKSRQSLIELQEATFRQSTLSRLRQQQSTIDKLRQLLASDSAIIAIREEVVMAARAQLENGVITANDYLREVNAADQARQEGITHGIQLIEAQVNYRTLQGNSTISDSK